MSNVVRTAILTIFAAGMVGALMFRYLRIERSWSVDLPAPLANRGVLPLHTSAPPPELVPYRNAFWNRRAEFAADSHFPAPPHVIGLLPGADTSFYHRYPGSGMEIALLRRQFPGPAAELFAWRDDAASDWRPIKVPGLSHIHGDPIPVPGRAGRLILNRGFQPSELIEIDYRQNTLRVLCTGEVLGLNPERSHLAFTASISDPTHQPLRIDQIRDLYVWDLDAGHITRIARLTDSGMSGRSWTTRWAADSRILSVSGSAVEHRSFQWIYDTHSRRLQAVTAPWED